MNKKIYHEELSLFVANEKIDFLDNKSVLITGASGLIGSYIVDVLMKNNEIRKSNIKIYALVRNEQVAKDRFQDYKHSDLLKILNVDITKNVKIDTSVDYIIHAASNANPKAFDEDPIGTITANVNGTQNLLNYARMVNAKFLYLSSSEVYGEPLVKNMMFRENQMGVVDPLLPRSCYTESKRMAENICVNYSKQYRVHTNIVRIGFAYGPTFTEKDNRVIPQFIRSGLYDENIVMKSAGSLVRSYIYLYDVVSGIFKVLHEGKNSEAYNISNSNSNVSIKDIAETVAQASNKKIKYILPESDKKKGYAPFSAGLIDSSKLENLGWKCLYDIDQGINQILKIHQNRETKK